MKVGYFALAATLCATPALADDQFDLICTSKHSDATFHYRLDLKADLWCVTRAESDPCPTVIFTAIGSDIILFSTLPYQYADRLTGEWYYKDGGILYRGACERRPFTGFPKLETKF